MNSLYVALAADGALPADGTLKTPLREAFTRIASGYATRAESISLFGSYHFNDRLSLRGGIDNLLDQEPRIVAGDLGTDPAAGCPGSPGCNNNAYNTMPAYYDVLGRRAYVALKMSFDHCAGRRSGSASTWSPAAAIVSGSKTRSQESTSSALRPIRSARTS
jgi:hypothetical protein